MRLKITKAPYTFLLILLSVLSWQSALAETIRRGMGPEPDSLHIHQAQGLSSIQLLREIREGLVTFDVHGEPAPGVAQSWEILNQGQLYRFHLRENARWSNGDVVIARDFVRAWRQAVSPQSASRNSSLLSAVLNSNEILAGNLEPSTLGIEAIDEHTLEVRLSHRQPWFIEILAHPVSYPLHISDTETPKNAITNGAFVIESMTPHAMIRLLPNAQFHAAQSIRIAALELLPIEDPAAELSRYRSGELHITESIPPGRYQWLQENMPGELKVSPYLGSFWLGFNLTRAPFKASPELRKALSLAINREILVRVILGAGELPAWSTVPPGFEGYENDVSEFLSLNQKQREELARKLFAQAGYGPANPLRIELRYNSSSQHRRMAVAVAAMWKQNLGVASELINEEWKVFVNNRRQGVLTQVFRGGWIADYADPASFLELFRSDDAMNWSAYSNPEYDRLLEKASLLEGSERLRLLKQSESLLMRDMPVIPLYYYVSRHLVKPGVIGYENNVRDIHLSRYLSIKTGSK
ncbi:MAG: oligopeptide transport system substrate-binding protein [Lysobacterales bacterium]|jgi:oligopeptide transport system substrate-binding protein